MVAQPLLEFEAAELAVRLDHGPLAVRPPGLDRVQPRALARQAADQQAAAGAGQSREGRLSSRSAVPPPVTAQLGRGVQGGHARKLASGHPGPSLRSVGNGLKLRPESRALRRAPWRRVPTSALAPVGTGYRLLFV